MESVFGILFFCKNLTIGLSKKYKKPVMIMGTKRVENNTATGLNKNEIFVHK